MRSAPKSDRDPIVRKLLAVAALAIPIALAPPARADDATSKPADTGRYSLIEENDYFNPVDPSDHHYTQGLRLSYLTGEVREGDVSAPLFAWFDRYLFVGDGERSQHVDWAIGQSIFTPTNLVSLHPDPHDRPYAGWSYLQGGLVQSTDRNRLDDLELQVGVVGPAALASQAQNDWHEYFMHEAVSNGWGSQLKNEPGLDVTYERHWRYDVIGDGRGVGMDFTPDAGGALGNVLTYANAGAMLRVGYQLDANYGPSRILPAPSGGDYFDSSVTGPGGYLFAAVEGRGVGRNIFLQGNSFTTSPGVTAYPAVGDLVAGATAFWGRWLRANVSFDERSKEFVGQHGPDRFTSLSISANFDW
jgi:hypothetical protein